MGMIGGLFTSKAPENYIDDSDLAKRGFNTVNANGAVQGGLNQTLNTQQNASAAQGLGLAGAGVGFGQALNADQSQQGLAGALQARVNGTAGPSIAEQQLKQSLGQVQQQGAGSLAAARGISPGTAARLISANQTNAAQTAAGQGAILRSQEQQAAENQLANVNNMRAQSGLGMSQVGFGGFGSGAQAGTQALGTAGAINQGQNALAADLSKANLASKNGTDQMNTKAANDAGMGMLNAAGSAMALAHGGEVPETESLASHLLKSHAHLSEAHGHLARYATGGEVHGSYDFPAMDLTGGKKPPNKVQYVPHNGMDVSPSSGQTAAEPGKEGTDSEGKKKELHLAKGGPVPKPKPVYVPHGGPVDVSPTAGTTSAEPGQEGTDSEGNKKVLKLAGGGLIGAGVHALGQLLGIGENDAVHAGNTENGTTYQMDSSTYHPVYGQGSTFGPDASDESAGLETGPKLGALDAAPSMGMAAEGGPVPGHASVPGNSLKNDTVPAMLSPGEVVLPRTVSHDPDAAAEFVEHINARRKASEDGGPKGFGRVLAKQNELHNRLSALEAHLDGRK